MQFFLCMSMHSVFQSCTCVPGSLVGNAKKNSLLFILAQHEGWWSYEFCYHGKIRQVHVDNDKVRVCSINLSFCPAHHNIFFCYSVYPSPQKKSQDVTVQELLASNGDASSVLSYNVAKIIYLAFTLNNSNCSFSFIDIATYAIKSC